MSQIVPIPRVPVSVRPATLDDLPFMDGLQKKHQRQLGYFPTKQFEGYIAMGGVLIAETRRTEDSGLSGIASSVTQSSVLSPQSSTPVGYIISRDRYLKRDELGVIYQLCVVPGEQRKLVGAALVGAVFERSAYGCKLYCCWCAQDLEANHFWESLGFVPIAFRAGSSGKGRRPQARVHIFWQRRIREGDETTPYWYPSQTNSGAIREDRLVFPIPPGTHWSEVTAVVLPDESTEHQVPNHKRISSSTSRIPNGKKPVSADSSRQPISRTTGLRFAAREAAPVGPKARKPREKKPKVKHHPQLVAAARELRDRWLERINADGGASQMLSSGKYEVARALGSRSEPHVAPALPGPRAA